MGGNIFVESDRVAKTGRKNKKRLLVMAGIFLTVVVLALVLWNTEQGRDLLAKLGIPVSQNDKKKDKDAESQPTNMLNYKASQLAISGDTKAAIELYQSEIDGISNTENKAEKLLEISNLLWNNGEASDANKQLAIDYAKQAEQVHPTAQGAATLYQIYQRIGNTTEAQRYQKLLEERGGDNAPYANGGS
ncbi:MAG: hypothetical protein ABIQ64_00415 [Candidatus Saccharimonadales bacterium]